MSWAFAQFCIYCIFANNLHFTFKDTALAISGSMLLFLYLSIIFIFLIQSTYTILYLLYYNQVISEDNFVEISAAMIVCSECIDLVVSILLVYLFLRNLFALFRFDRQHRKWNKQRVRANPGSVTKKEQHFENMLLRTGSIAENAVNFIGPEQDGVNNKSDSKTASLVAAAAEDNKSVLSDLSTKSLNGKQKSIILTASKHTILATVAIVSTQLYLVSGVINNMSWTYFPSYYTICFYTHTMLLSVDCLINALCICLNFEINTMYYDCICGDCCNSLCIWSSKRCCKQ